MKNTLIGCIYGLFAQILTFLQLQGNVKYHFYEKHPFILLAFSVPISWLYIQSVDYLVKSFNGQIWPSRFIGFALGMLVFTLMAATIFKEPITLKTFLCMVLACGILLIQLFLK